MLFVVVVAVEGVVVVVLGNESRGALVGYVLTVLIGCVNRVCHQRVCYQGVSEGVLTVLIGCVTRVCQRLC